MSNVARKRRKLRGYTKRVARKAKTGGTAHRCGPGGIGPLHPSVTRDLRAQVEALHKGFSKGAHLRQWQISF